MVEDCQREECPCPDRCVRHLRYERDRLAQELRKAKVALEDCIERERRAK